MATTNAAYKFDYNDYCLQWLDFYRPQRSWGKVIFSQASVILSIGGMCAWGACVARGGHVCLGGVHG